MRVTISRHSCCYCSGCSYCCIRRLFRLLRGVVYLFQWKIESVKRDQAQLEGSPRAHSALDFTAGDTSERLSLAVSTGYKRS